VWGGQLYVRKNAWMRVLDDVRKIAWMRVLDDFGRGKQDDEKLANVALCWHMWQVCKPSHCTYDEHDM